MKQPFQITSKETAAEGVITLEPLDQGFGQTLGNALRRVMLSHLTGAAPVRVKIKGVEHQFTTLKGMKEDIVELILNLKQLHIFYEGESSEVLKLAVSGPGEIKASDLITPSTVKIANPDLILANLADKKSKLSLELTIEKGRGYVLAEEQGKQKLGVIPLDANFSPVEQVAFTVAATRIGRQTDYDKLVLTIKTNSTVTPSHAVKRAAAILVEHFQQIVAPSISKKSTISVSSTTRNQAALKLTVEELDIPTRIANALRKGGYATIGDLVSATTKDLSKIKNIGEKSIKEVIQKVRKLGIEIG